MRRISTAFIPLALLAAAVVFLAYGHGRAVAQTTEQVVQPDREISANTDPRADLALQGRLNKLFDEVDGLSRVFALVRDGVVRLTGKVAESALSRAAESLSARVEGVVIVENDIEIDTDITNRIEPLWKRVKADLQNIVLFLPLFVVGVFVVILFWVMAQVLIWIAGPVLRRTPNEFVQNIVKNAIRLVFMAIGILMALEAMDATQIATSILGAAGLVGLAVGFAVKDTIENYLASVLLSVRQPFSPHEVVNIDGHEGMVARLTARTTVLINFDGNHVRIPNATVFKATIVNYSREPKRRFDFKLGIDPACDLDVARALVVTTLEDFDAVLNDPGPTVAIDELGDWAVILWIAAWIDQRETDITKARSESLRLIKGAFDSAGIRMPNPTYTIVSEDGGAKPARAKRARPPATPAEPVAQDTSVDRVMDEAVERDREQAQVPDLLQATAEKE